MRGFTTKEDEIIKLLVKTKSNYNIQELQFARILRKRLECLGIKWETTNKSALTIYTQHSDTDKEKNKLILQKSFFDICDFLYFIKELEEYKFVEIQTVAVSDSSDKFTVLYDKENWKYDENKDKFIFKEFNSEIEVDGITYSLEELFPCQDKHIIFNNIVKELNKYSTAVIYPLPVAADYLKWHCLSIPRRQRLIDISISSLGVIVAAIAVIVSVKCDEKDIQYNGGNQYNFGNKSPILVKDECVAERTDTINDTVRVFHNVIIESELIPQLK